MAIKGGMVREELQAHLDELMAQYRNTREQLAGLQEQMASLEATVTAANELITVKVGPQGQLVDLKLEPRVYRKLSSAELAEAILAATAEAAAQVAGRAHAALEPFGSSGTGPGAGGDFVGMLPEHPENLDEFRERYGLLGRD